MTNPATKGFITSEFFGFVGTTIAIILVYFGVISVDVQSEFGELITTTVASAVAMLTLYKSQSEFRQGRIDLKNKMIDTGYTGKSPAESSLNPAEPPVPTQVGQIAQ